jgi:hypothetical protein
VDTDNSSLNVLSQLICLLSKLCRFEERAMKTPGNESSKPSEAKMPPPLMCGSKFGEWFSSQINLFSNFLCFFSGFPIVPVVIVE